MIKIKKNRIFEYLLIVLLFAEGFSSYFNNGFEKEVFRVISLLTAIFLFIVRLNIKESYRKYEAYYYLLMALYLVGVFYSTYVNRSNHYFNSLMSGTIYIVSIIFIDLVLFFLKSKAFLIESIKDLFILVTLFCWFNDLLALVHLSQVNVTQSFVFSGKFSVAYMHLEWIALYLLCIQYEVFKLSHYKFLLLLMAIYTFVICFLINCMTGVVGIILLIVLAEIIPDKILINPFVWLISLIGSTSFVIYYEKIISIPIMKFIIVDLLHRSETLTGRTAIYDKIPLILNQHWLFGFGYGSDYETWQIFGYRIANSQNGLMNMIIEQGLISTVLFICWGYLIIKLAKNNIKIKPLIAMIYVLTFLGTIEITFTINLIFLFILTYYLNNYEKYETKYTLERNNSGL